MLIKIDNVLNAAELSTVRALIENASWQSGASSAGKYARTGKSNREMDQSCTSWKQTNQLVVSRLCQNPVFQGTVLPLHVSAAFVARYHTGDGYGPHIDDPVMGEHGRRYRADIAVTVFLNQPTEYGAGELSIDTRFGPNTVKLNAGSAVAYPASSLHEVKKITSGERLVCALWAQSLVRDAHQREILCDLDDARRALQMATPGAKVAASVDQAYMNLVRLWAEC